MIEMKLIFVLAYILPILIFFFTRIGDVTPVSRTRRFWKFTIILVILIALFNSLPYISNYFEMKIKDAKLRNATLDELKINIEIAYKWKASLNRAFPWGEFFSFQKYDNVDGIQEGDLSKRLIEIYRKLKNVDPRLKNFAMGIGLSKGEERDRVIFILTEIIKEGNAILKDFKQKEKTTYQNKLSPEKMYSDKEITALFSDEFTAQKISPDSTSLIWESKYE